MEPGMNRMVSLNGRNYHVWKGKMEDLLYVKRWHLPVFGSTKPENMTDSDWELEHKVVCGFIRQYVDDNVLNHISKEINGKALWEKLESLYARKTGNNKMFLIKQFMALKYSDGQSISDHLNEFQGVLDQLSAMNIKFEDELQGLWLLGTLPDSWETFRMSLSNSAPDGIVTMDFAKSGILNEEMRRKSQASPSHSDVLFTEHRGRSQSRGPKDKFKNRSKSRSWQKNVECHHCGKKGHIKKNCFQLKREKKNGNADNEKKDPNRDDRVATASTAADELVIVCHDNSVNLAYNETSWVIDSGASFHITSKMELFTTYTPGDFGTLKMGNDGLTKVVGMGNVCLNTNNGTQLILKDVRHVPEIRLNLISTGKLDDEGYCNTFYNGQWKLSKGC